MNAVIQFTPDGTARAVYTEELPLADLGTMTIKRASTVEFNPATQQWEVRFTQDPGNVVYASPSRAACVRWEVEQLNAALQN
jgi:hypothetical protein